VKSFFINPGLTGAPPFSGSNIVRNAGGSDRTAVVGPAATALSLTETAKVFHFVRQVRASGRSIVFIGHNIHHVYDIAERFVVIDRGRVAMEKAKSEIGSAQELIEYMEEVARPQAAATGEVV